MSLAEIFWNAYVRSGDAYSPGIQLADLGPEHQTAIEAGCAAVEEHVLAAVVCPHGHDMAAAEPPAAEPVLYAKVEQMGYRSRTGTVRETEFAGRKMLELTLIPAGTVHLVSPDSIYEITWMSRDQAERLTGTGAHAPAAIGRGEPHHGDPDPNSPDSFGEDLPRVSPLPSWEIEQHARDMAAEDGDFDRCEPTL